MIQAAEKTVTGGIRKNQLREEAAQAVRLGLASVDLPGRFQIVPGTPAHLQGSLAPDLHGVGARYTEAELAAHITAPERFNPDTIMPAYARTDGLINVNRAWIGKPVLQLAQIDDIIAYLLTLKDPP